MRSLYGLLQLPCQWNKTLNKFLLTDGLKRSTYDLTLYYTLRNDKLEGLVVVHVDDLSVTGTNSFQAKFQGNISKSLCLSKDKKLKEFLSLTFPRETQHHILVSEQKYIEDTARRFLGDTSRRRAPLLTIPSRLWVSQATRHAQIALTPPFSAVYFGFLSAPDPTWPTSSTACHSTLPARTKCTRTQVFACCPISPAQKKPDWSWEARHWTSSLSLILNGPRVYPKGALLVATPSTWVMV